MQKPTIHKLFYKFITKKYVFVEVIIAIKTFGILAYLKKNLFKFQGKFYTSL